MALFKSQTQEHLSGSLVSFGMGHFTDGKTETELTRE
jgi:hypothetical protein